MGKPTIELIAFTPQDNPGAILAADGKPLLLPGLIETCGRTCYKSPNPKTIESARKFCSGIIANGHLAMSEFSWQVLEIKCRLSKDHATALKEWNEFFEQIKDLEGLLYRKKIHLRYTLRQNSSLLISGNIRAFRELANCAHRRDNCFVNAINRYFKSAQPDLFFDIIRRPPDDMLAINDQPTDLDWDEQFEHLWFCFRAVGSRAFTHQLVRHRQDVDFAQESQRYCDESGFFDSDYFVMPPQFAEVGTEEFFLSSLKEADGAYKKLLDFLERFGVKGKAAKQDARFLLPNAVKSEICIAAPLSVWFPLFYLRCDPHAQWEIRNLMEQAQQMIFKIVPEAENRYQDYKKWRQSEDALRKAAAEDYLRSVGTPSTI